VTHTVALPAWLLLCIGALALWALWDHLLGPAWRGFMSRTANQVIDELSTRLRIGIRPWQRTRRQALIGRLITDPKVEARCGAVRAAEQAEPTGCAADRGTVRARNRPCVQCLFLFPDRLLARAQGCAIAVSRAAGVRRLGRPCAGRFECNVVFVMNHRSNMDYVLAAYLAAEQTSLSYAVGEWAQIWPLSCADPLDGRLLRSPPVEERTLPAGTRAAM
jgi:glycerol-3-phosphate O-acyltransferase